MVWAASALALCQVAVGAQERAFAVIVGLDDFSGAQGNWQNLTACVNDAVDVAQVLAQQSLYQGADGQERIHLFTQAVPGAANSDPSDIAHVKRYYGFADGKYSVLDVLDGLNREAAEEDLILVFISTHGEYIESGDGAFRELRLLLPDYDPGRKSTYLTFSDIFGELRTAPARLVFLLNSCHAEGTMGVASDDYYDLLERRGRCRFVVTACKQNQSSYIRMGDKRSLFGQALVEALEGAEEAVLGASGDVTVENTFQYLKRNVKKRAADLGHKQEPVKRDYPGGLDSYTVLSRPARTGPVVGPTTAEGLPGLIEVLESSAVLNGRARDEALTVLSLYLRDVEPAAEEGSEPSAAEIEQARRLLSEANYRQPEDLDEWERDRLALPPADQPQGDAEERSEKRVAWVGVLRDLVQGSLGDTAQDYYAMLAAAGIPPAVSRVKWGAKWSDLEYQEDEPVPLDVPFENGEGVLNVLVAAAKPEFLIEPETSRPSATGAHQLQVSLWNDVQPQSAGSGGVWIREGDEENYRKTETQPAPIRLTGKDTLLLLRVREEGRQDLISAPRKVIVRCPESLTVDQPANGSSVYQPTQELQGRVWHARETEPQVTVEGAVAAQVALDGPDEQGVYTWRANVITMQDGSNDLTVSAQRPNGDPIGDVRLTLEVVRIPVLGEAPEGMRFRAAPGGAPEAGQPVTVYLYSDDIAVLEGKFRPDGGEVRAAINRMSPVRRPVVVDVADDAFSEDVLQVDPTDVPLTTLDGYTDDDAVDRDKDPWEFAAGTYRVQVPDEWSDVWQVSVDGDGEPDRITVGTDEAEYRFVLSAERYADAELLVSTQPQQPEAKIRLRRQWQAGAEPRAIEAGRKMENLEAGQYTLEVEYGTDAELELNTEELPDGVRAVETLEEGVTLALVIPSASRRGPVELVLPFRDRYPPLPLPFEPQVESYVSVDGVQFGPLPAQEANVRLPRDVTSGKVVVAARDTGLEYWQGRLRNGKIEAGDGGAIRGSFRLADAGREVGEATLTPAEGGVPYRDPEYSPEPSNRKTMEWDRVPVGDHELNVKLALPGLDPVALEETVPIREGKTVRGMGQLLAALDIAALKSAIRQHPVTITVNRGGQGVGAEALAASVDEAEVRLVPDRLALVNAVKFLEKSGLPEAAALLADYQVPDRTATNGTVVYEEGLREGTYRVTVRLQSGDEWLVPEPREIEVSAGNDQFDLYLTSAVAEFPFSIKDPDEVGTWTVRVNGVQRGAVVDKGKFRLQLLQEAEQGQVEIGRRDLVIWRGRLADGKLQAAGGTDGFVRGVFVLGSAVPGMTGKLTCREGRVPYTAIAPGYQPKNPTPARDPGSMEWGDVLVGEYYLTVDAFERVTVTVEEGPATELDATELEAEVVSVKLELPAGIDEGAVESAILVPDKVLAVEVSPDRHQELKKGLDLRQTGWQPVLPLGTYRLKVTYRDQGQAREREWVLTVE